jgi:hypothetical protein
MADKQSPWEPRSSSKNETGLEARTTSAPNIDINTESDRLTKRIAAAEQLLTSVPWKIEATVDFDDKYLTIGRLKSGWALYVERVVSEHGDTDVDFLARDASVEVKARIAELLPQLLQAMIDGARERENVLKAGHAALDKFDEVVRREFGLKGGA